MFGALYRIKMDEEENEEKENLLETDTTTIRPPAKRNNQILRLLFIIGVSLNTLFGILGIFTFASFLNSGKSSYENGFDTDLEPAREKIDLIVKTFTGGVELDDAGNFYTDDGGHEYVGPPGPEVDEAWETLLGLNLDLDEDEVVLKGSTFQWPESGNYFTGIDVYHSLHCLNRLRQAIYPEYYTRIFNHPSDPSRKNHIETLDHCINHIRQAIQCHADLTPMEWRLDGNKIILKTNTQHTCRNFEQINGWALSKRTKFEDIHSWRNGSLQIVD
ncbi:conserved hypothetical protein [Talaromyces stipitatus ATCC 10500]|uniref:Tat pathway signal sequence n=1 Tax=Talaromyces stipitatus (strain ATCC 10500 / CBS 375.48 / QM 6759 / NRRL 1006) TaxID=441959 RepID=B8M0Q6_TALSN|nr:uncharacterized protein TSTA_086720 [Talaromyces stipitatus ATCC 10500]EED21439.1 conserved hypothetical protein [Talaromyces stipitatus ATCC 10500]